MLQTDSPRFLNNPQASRQLRKLKKLFGIMDVKPIHMIIPILFSFASAVFSGISLGLLIPMAKGIVANDFGFVASIPVLGTILTFFLGGLGFEAASSKLILFLLIGFILGAQVLKNITGYLSHVFLSYVNCKFVMNMSKALFRRYLTFGKMYFDRSSQGKLQTVMGYSKEVLELLNSFQRFMHSIFFLVAHFIILFIISWELTILTVILFPAFHYSVRGILEKIRSLSDEKKTESLRIGHKIFNAFSIIPLIKMYSYEKETSHHYNDLLQKQRNLEFRSSVMSGLIGPLHEIIFIVVLLAIVVFVSLYLTGDALIGMPALIVFLYTARETLPKFLMLGNARGQFANLRGPVTEVLKVFEDTGKFKIPDGNREFTKFTGSIEFRNMDFKYIEGIPILQKLNMTIEKGQMTALVGATGAGKTTIINLLLRMYDCDPQSIFIDGKDIREYRIASLHQKMAYVSQEPLLFNDTFRMNLSFGLDTQPSEDELNRVIEQARLHDFIDSLPEKLDTDIGDRGMKLSGGEKQRLSIARALLKQADIFIFDEATSSLDSHTEQLIQEAIAEAIQNRTALIVAHRLFTIQHADKIIVLDKGTVAEEGTLQELQDRKGLFHSYWKTQQFF